MLLRRSDAVQPLTWPTNVIENYLQHAATLVRDELDVGAVGEHDVHAAPRVRPFESPPVAGARGVLRSERVTRRRDLSRA